MRKIGASLLDIMKDWRARKEVFLGSLQNRNHKSSILCPKPLSCNGNLFYYSINIPKGLNTSSSQLSVLKSPLLLLKSKFIGIDLSCPSEHALKIGSCCRISIYTSEIVVFEVLSTIIVWKIFFQECIQHDQSRQRDRLDIRKSSQELRYGVITAVTDPPVYHSSKLTALSLFKRKHRYKHF